MLSLSERDLERLGEAAQDRAEQVLSLPDGARLADVEWEYLRTDASAYVFRVSYGGQSGEIAIAFDTARDMFEPDEPTRGWYD